MGLFRRALPYFDRRVDWRVDRKLEERVLPQFPRQQEALTSLSEDLAGLSQQLLFTMSELRRWMVDDLAAANETTVLLGESLTRLQGGLDHLSAQLERLAQRVEGIETALSEGVEGVAGNRSAGIRPA